MEYDPPHHDAAPPAPSQQYVDDPFYDLLLGSKNYWAGRTGREYPPAPTFRMVRGKKMLGRYMDAFGCQAHMRGAGRRWEKWYTGFFISCGITLLFADIDWVFCFIALPAYALWYFSVKAKHRRQYDRYFAVQDEVLRSGEPEWVPYDKDRLKLIDKNPLAVWP
jgi:hypothetical protein